MYKNKLSLLLLLGILNLVSSCGNQQTKEIKFRGIYADDANGTEGIYNPGRGFRLETAVDILLEKDTPLQELKNETEKYRADSVSLSQSYFYLTNVIGENLTEDDFSVMQNYFDELRRLGKKSVLRFAYERDFNGRQAKGPTLEQALSHLDQLKPFLEKNKDLILVVQAGVIGAWGEWHSSVHGLDQSDDAKRAILRKLIEVVPAEKAVQVRVPEYKNLLKDDPKSYERLSFHDDMIIIQPHKWDGNMHEGTPFFDQIVKESPLLPVDGELPWGFWSINQDPDSPDAGWLIDGPQAARRFFLQHFTSLSVVHNYLEKRGREDKPELKYSMQIWKETPITLDYLKAEKMPISANYFENKDGSSAERMVFDYVRDHLGYRIELQRMNVPTVFDPKGINTINLELINRGFSTIYNKYEVHFVLIDKDENIIEFPTNANTNDWQPYLPQDSSFTPIHHTIKGEIRSERNLQEGKYKLGLWIADASDRLKYDNRYAIRCANGDTEWYVSKDKKYGINILTDIEISH